MLVVPEVAHPSARDGREGAEHIVVVLALQLDRADEASARARIHPATHEPQQPLRVARDVGEEPVDGPHLVRVEADRLLQLKTVTLRGAHCTYDWILIAPSEARLKVE